MKYARLKPGSLWYYGSSEPNPTRIPPCSFFAKARESAGRFILQPGVEGYLVARSVVPAKLIAPLKLLHVGRGEEETRKLFAGVYEHEKAADFCANRDRFPGVDGWYNDMSAGGILLFEPDKFMRYGRAVPFPVKKVQMWLEQKKQWDV